MKNNNSVLVFFVILMIILFFHALESMKPKPGEEEDYTLAPIPDLGHGEVEEGVECPPGRTDHGKSIEQGTYPAKILNQDRYADVEVVDARYIKICSMVEVSATLDILILNANEVFVFEIELPVPTPAKNENALLGAMYIGEFEHDHMVENYDKLSDDEKFVHNAKEALATHDPLSVMSPVGYNDCRVRLGNGNARVSCDPRIALFSPEQLKRNPIRFSYTIGDF